MPNNIRRSKNIEDFFTSCDSLVSLLQTKKNKVVATLSDYETHETIIDEINRSIDTLNGMRKEISAINHPLQNLSISTFFPLNLPLYSLVLFGLAPSAFAKNVFIRPPEVMHETLKKLWKLLDISNLFPAVSLKVTPRQIFVQLYGSMSDAIIFTGKYKNALDIYKNCPQSLLLYNGSGINPFLLFDNADIDLAVKKAIEMRCFNSGQDCAGPDAFFVPSQLVIEFINKLKVELRNIKVGDTVDPKTNIGPTIKESYITELRAWLANEKDYLIYGGQIDTKKRLVKPSIVHKKVTQHGLSDFHEFFAPYFYILEYSDISELKHTLLSKNFRERGMYISVFGDNPKVEKKLDFVKILKNQIVNDVEHGNQEYGGYGDKANFLIYKGKKTVKPILLSRDMHTTLSGQSKPQV